MKSDPTLGKTVLLLPTRGAVTRNDDGFGSHGEDDPVLIFLLCRPKMANGAAATRQTDGQKKRRNERASCVLGVRSRECSQCYVGQFDEGRERERTRVAGGRTRH